MPCRRRVRSSLEERARRSSGHIRPGVARTVPGGGWGLEALKRAVSRGRDREERVQFGQFKEGLEVVIQAGQT